MSIRMDDLLKEMLGSGNEDDCPKEARELEGMIFFVDALNLKKKLSTSYANMENLQEVLRHKVSVSNVRALIVLAIPPIRPRTRGPVTILD
jgi:hypothetical protein